MSNNKKAIWFPLFIADMTTATQILSNAEMGIYIRLLMHYYEKEKPIQDNQPRLKRMLQIESAQDIKALNYVLDEFFDYDAEKGEYRNHRADLEIIELRKKKDQRKAAWEASARKRKEQKASDRLSEHQATAPTTKERPLTQNSERTASQSQLQSQVKKEEDKSSSQKKGLANEKSNLKDKQLRWDLFPRYCQLAQEIETIDYTPTEQQLKAEFDKYCDWIGAKDPRIKDYEYQWTNWVRKFTNDNPQQQQCSTGGKSGSKLLAARRNLTARKTA